MGKIFYKAHLLEDAGYVMTPNGSGYIARNAQEFVYEYSAPQEGGMTMQ